MKKKIFTMCGAIMLLMVFSQNIAHGQVQPIGPRWWKDSTATFVGSVQPLKSNPDMLLATACVAFSCDSLGEIFIANSNGRLTAKGADSVCIHFGGRIPGMTLGLQAANQREYIRAISAAGQWRCDVPAAVPATYSTPTPPQPDPTAAWLTVIRLLADKVGTPVATPKVEVNVGGDSIVVNNDITINTGGDGDTSRAFYWQGGAYVPPSGGAAAVFGARTQKSLVSGAGVSLIVGGQSHRSDSTDLILGVSGDGWGKLFSAGRFAFKLGGEASILSGINFTSRLDSFNLHSSESGSITNPDGTVTTYIRHFDDQGALLKHTRQLVPARATLAAKFGVTYGKFAVVLSGGVATEVDNGKWTTDPVWGAGVAFDNFLLSVNTTGAGRIGGSVVVVF